MEILFFVRVDEKYSGREKLDLEIRSSFWKVGEGRIYLVPTYTNNMYRKGGVGFLHTKYNTFNSLKRITYQITYMEYITNIAYTYLEVN